MSVKFLAKQNAVLKHSGKHLTKQWLDVDVYMDQTKTAKTNGATIEQSKHTVWINFCANDIYSSAYTFHVEEVGRERYKKKENIIDWNWGVAKRRSKKDDDGKKDT